jgi:membrane carboxypeptidase/penicillin-binding protein
MKIRRHFSLKKIFSVLALSAITLAAAYALIIVLPQPEILERDYILSVIASETPIYYSDRQHILGVYFTKDHRNYLTYDKIPQHFVHALVSAEDKNFYSHRGLDFLGIVRATLVNLWHGKVVQGASTLTQLAIRNITYRQMRTFIPKITEMINALRMERKYSKNDILEFIANQFYVNANGRGLYIAAKYFFSKEVSDLSLIENAFIAGAFKGPNLYNSNFYKVEDKKKQAYERAMARKGYVIANMQRNGFLSEAEAVSAIAEPLVFRFSEFTFDANVLVDMVSEELNSSEIRQILTDAGITNIATSGIKIYSSIDFEMQQAATVSVQDGLEATQVRLNGYSLNNSSETRFADLLAGEIAEVSFKNLASGFIKVNFEGKVGFIRKEGLKKIADTQSQFEQGIWAEAGETGLKKLANKFKVGNKIWVKILAEEPGKEIELALRVAPELNGGLIALDGGKIVALSGGYENKFFNRAMNAYRQPGSIFKLLVYLAALQLGWSNIDVIPNRLMIYPYHNLFYIPKPDHPPASDFVSIDWAGVKSENLATVYLLYHLLDQLDTQKFQKVAGLLGLSRGSRESEREYLVRLRDGLGILLNEEKFSHRLFQEVAAEYASDLTFSGRTEEAGFIRHLDYGYGYAGEVERLQEEKTLLQEKMLESRFEGASYAENRENIEEKISLLSNHFAAYQKKAHALSSWIESDSAEPEIAGEMHLAVTDEFKRLVVFKTKDYGILPKASSTFNFVTSYPISLASALEQSDIKDIYIEGRIKVGDIQNLEQLLKTAYNKHVDPDSLASSALYYHQDFRTAMALKYVVYLTKILGVKTKLEEVLSFPLGSNAVTLKELAIIYQSIAKGQRFFVGKTDREYTLIDSIEDRNGEVLYKSEITSIRVIDASLSDLMNQIMGKATRFGTGADIQKYNRILFKDSRKRPFLSLAVPVFGKTGTTNDYVNAAFAGFFPHVNRSGKVSAASSVSIATYLGYDDNRPMRNRTLRISGSSGALPIWGNFIQSWIEGKKLDLQMDPFEFTKGKERTIPFLPSSTDRCSVAVNAISGIPESGDDDARVAWEEYYGDCDEDGLQKDRFFLPFDPTQLALGQRDMVVDSFFDTP